MAEVTISDLTTATSVTGAELLEIEQGGTSKKVTASLIAALGGGGGGGGGSGTVDVTGTPVANQVPIWTDATTLKGTSEITVDSDANMYANNFSSSYATHVTGAGSTTLTVASPYQQYFTGSATQACILPVASTLAAGHRFFIANSSTGSLTVQSSGFEEVVILAEGESAMVTCILASGTSSSSWSVVIPSGVAGSSSAVDTTGIPVANQLAIFNDVDTIKGSSGVTTDSSNNLFVNNVNARYTSTATAASTTTLTIASSGQQYFTGSTTQTVVLPVTSTLVLGHQFYIYNASTGDVTVNSSGGAEVAVLVQDTSVLVTCILTSGTGATSWNAIETASISSVDIATQVTGLGTAVATALGNNANATGGFSTGTGTATLTNKTINNGTNTLAVNTASYAANHTATTAECYGSVLYVTAAATITLPAVAAGMSLTVITIGAVAVSVDPNASEILVLDGTALTGGHKATNLSTAGDIITLTYYGSGSWHGASNAWTDGG